MPTVFDRWPNDVLPRIDTKHAVVEIARIVTEGKEDTHLGASPILEMTLRLLWASRPLLPECFQISLDGGATRTTITPERGSQIVLRPGRIPGLRSATSLWVFSNDQPLDKFGDTTITHADGRQLRGLRAFQREGALNVDGVVAAYAVMPDQGSAWDSQTGWTVSATERETARSLGGYSLYGRYAGSTEPYDGYTVEVPDYYWRHFNTLTPRADLVLQWYAPAFNSIFGWGAKDGEVVPMYLSAPMRYPGTPDTLLGITLVPFREVTSVEFGSPLPSEEDFVPDRDVAALMLTEDLVRDGLFTGRG